MENKIYDVAIIGGGMAGYSAGIYSARFGMSCIVLAKDRGGLIATTDNVENWPGEKSISGAGLAKKLSDHLSEYHVPSEIDEILEVSRAADGIFHITGIENKYLARSIILATGTEHRKLSVPGEKEFLNRGVSYCAICDAAFFKNKVVAVIGGSDSSAIEALMLAEHASKVYMIYRGEKLRAEPINLEKIKSNKKIELISKTNITKILGEKSVKKVVLDKPFNGSGELELSGIFVAVGHVAQSTLAKQLGVKLSESGEIIANGYMHTSIPGVFAAGDVIDFKFKQAIVSSAQGTIAAYSAFEFLGQCSGKK